MNNVGLSSGNSQNNQDSKSPLSSSKFPLSYASKQTMRFGEITPHFVMSSEDKDIVPLRSIHELRTTSLKAPLMQDIIMRKAYFNVPKESILPLNWYKIATQPNIGDDIDASKFGTSVANFYLTIQSIIRNLITTFSGITSGNLDRFKVLIRLVQFGQLFFSRGSLLWNLGYKNVGWFSVTENATSKEFIVDFDDFLECFYSALQKSVLSSFSPSSYTEFETSYGFLVPSLDSLNKLPRHAIPGHSSPSFITTRQFIERLGHDADFTINFSSTALTTFFNKFYQELQDNYLVDLSPSYSWYFRCGRTNEPIDISRALAYQIVCAHFFTNDAVDYVYSADLYRQYIFSLADAYLSEVYDSSWYNHEGSFLYNGITCFADYLSALIFDVMRAHTDAISRPFDDSIKSSSFYQYFLSIFGYQNSLRYRDYFVGSRTRPLAVGNVDINTSGGSVSVIDITRNIQFQRFLNAVNRTGRKWSNYLKEIFGKAPAYDYHDPMYLGQTSDKAIAYEVENTGTAQQSQANSVTAVVRSNASKFAFEFHSDRPSILIGVTFFDIERNYTENMDKTLFHVDRFDMFNPFMQFIGDQPVTTNELMPVASNGTFGYQLRYAEYKQRVNSMAGGFIRKLPGYAFPNAESYYRSGSINLSPYFIRSHAWELDPFYVSLTGYSLESYFHFIVNTINDCDATRNMVYSPGIL